MDTSIAFRVHSLPAIAASSCTSWIIHVSRMEFSFHFRSSRSAYHNPSDITFSSNLPYPFFHFGVPPFSFTISFQVLFFSNFSISSPEILSSSSLISCKICFRTSPGASSLNKLSFHHNQKLFLSFTHVSDDFSELLAFFLSCPHHQVLYIFFLPSPLFFQSSSPSQRVDNQEITRTLRPEYLNILRPFFPVRIHQFFHQIDL